MSFVRSAIPVVLAVGLGIFNAQYIFKPALEDEAKKREQQTIAKGAAQSAPVDTKTVEAQAPVTKS